MRALPNLITFARLALVPLVGYALATAAYALALVAFLAAAVSDAVDGFIARRFGYTSRLGATLDPVADKLNMVVATLLLAWDALLPLWLAAAIVLRDVVIVAGALAYRFALGHLEIAPTRLSKLNTIIEFSLLALVMADAARWIDISGFRAAAFAATGATVVASGAQYVWQWGRKAISEARSR
jgi:cardiolipin synthase